MSKLLIFLSKKNGWCESPRRSSLKKVNQSLNGNLNDLMKLNIELLLTGSLCDGKVVISENLIEKRIVASNFFGSWLKRLCRLVMNIEMKIVTSRTAELLDLNLISHLKGDSRCLSSSCITFLIKS